MKDKVKQKEFLCRWGRMDILCDLFWEYLKAQFSQLLVTSLIALDERFVCFVLLASIIPPPCDPNQRTGLGQPPVNGCPPNSAGKPCLYFLAYLALPALPFSMLQPPHCHPSRTLRGFQWRTEYSWLMTHSTWQGNGPALPSNGTRSPRPVA